MANATPDGGSGEDGSGGASDRAGPFRPPGFLDALKTTFQPRGPRAQPASGGEEDARRVNYIDRRERIIASALAALQLVVAVVDYIVLRRVVFHASKTLTRHKAHVETLNDHHIAVYVLIVNALLALGIAAGVVSKRRSLVGFTVLLGGFGLLSYGGGIFGLAYIGVGLWLIFRSMKRRPATTRTPAAAAAASGSRSGSLELDRRELARASRATEAAVRKPPAASKRYTPPRQKPQSTSRKQAGEPEKQSRLTGWLKR